MLKGRDHFTDSEAETIRQLLDGLSMADRSSQKTLRSKIRRIGFRISDFDRSGSGFRKADFERLVKQGKVKIDADGALVSSVVASSMGKPKGTRSKDSDEGYIIGLCDEVLGLNGVRQKRFAFLTGDSGSRLPVDSYYETISLVIEYRERQHTESVNFFDKRLTVSGVDRGTQRRIYDQRRREVLPEHGISLVELSFDMFEHKASKRLKRDRLRDMELLAERLKEWRGAKGDYTSATCES